MDMVIYQYQNKVVIIHKSVTSHKFVVTKSPVANNNQRMSILLGNTIMLPHTHMWFHLIV